jgi:hypothetical protein
VVVPDPTVGAEVHHHDVLKFDHMNVLHFSLLLLFLKS